MGVWTKIALSQFVYLVNILIVLKCMPLLLITCLILLDLPVNMSMQQTVANSWTSLLKLSLVPNKSQPELAQDLAELS